MKKIKIIVISGPTASGKTALGVELAKRLSGEIVSADSMQLYKGIPIATAQPTREEMGGIPHHLMGFLGVGTPFSVADYVELAHKTIKEISNRGNTPIIVGGTGLYINSLVDDITFSEVGNTKVRQMLQAELERLGAEHMYKKLMEIDSEAAKKIEPKNTRRVIRALEVYMCSGLTFTKQNEISRQNESRYKTAWFNIRFKDRTVLYDRINQRVDLMLAAGILQEAKKYRVELANSGSGQAIGHKELYPYLDGKISLETAIENLKTATRRYAKRQITWFSRREDAIELPFNKNMLNTAFNLLTEGEKK